MRILHLSIYGTATTVKCKLAFDSAPFKSETRPAAAFLVRAGFRPKAQGYGRSRCSTHPAPRATASLPLRRRARLLAGGAARGRRRRARNFSPLPRSDRVKTVNPPAEACFSDEELVVRAARGDREAYGLLVRRHGGRIVKTLYYRVGDRDEAEDLAQEVFVRAYRGIGDFEGRASFGTWLYRIVHNVAASHFAARGARKRAGGRVPLDACAEAAAAPARNAAPSSRRHGQRAARRRRAKHPRPGA